MERTFSRTHPWITFHADFKPAPAPLWLLLGECQSKSDHIAGAPLLPAVRDRMMRIYLAKGALATAAIEGNTLSEEEVIQHLEGKLTLPPSREYLAQEVDNIITGSNMMLKELGSDHLGRLTPERIKQLNRIVLSDLKLDEGVVPGEYRKDLRGVARYKAPPADECDYLVGRLCDWLNSETFMPKPGTEIASAILRAVLAHLYLAWIHPFGDGNGRTARLVEFQLLLASGVPGPAAHLLSNHYNQTRTEYYRQLDMASRSGGDVVPFTLYAVEGFRDGLKEQLKVIRNQQWDLMWRNHVYNAFRDRESPTDLRRRRLVLDLSRKTEPVPIANLMEVSPKVAVAYSRKTTKTLSRDLHALSDMNLITMEPAGVRANKELLLGFLPPMADPRTTS